MPVVATPEGWVRVAAVTRKRTKPADPFAAYRGPLAYITGRPDIKGPSKRSPIPQQLTIEPAQPQPRKQRAFAPAPSPLDDHQPARPSRPRSRLPSNTVTSKAREAFKDTFEVADEEILQADLHSDMRSQRSASPRGARHSKSLQARAGHHTCTSRSHRDTQDDYKHGRHGDDYGEQNLRSERRYWAGEDQGCVAAHYAGAPPTLQPIVIYATPPMSSGCGSYHHNYVHSCQTPPRPQIQASSNSESRSRGFPLPTPSVASSRSGDSRASRALSYQWYNATQPLNI